MADETYDGRKPTFNQRGQVRGFRSRPGAPQADLTNNLPMSGASGTAKSNWDSMFKNSITGNNPLSQEARAPLSSTLAHEVGAASPVDTAMSEIFGFGIGPAPTNPQPLDILAAGGPTHAQSWGGDSFSPPGKSFKNNFGFGSSTFDKKLSAGYRWGGNSRAT